MIIGDKKEKQYRKELNDYLRVTLEFQKGLDKAKEYLSYFKKNNGIKSDFRFLYYMIAIFYRELNNPFYALTNLRKAENYSTIDFLMNNIWVRAQILQDLNSNDKALKLYKKCYDYYYNLGLKENYSSLLCNIGVITHDELLIKRSIKIYEQTEIEYIDDKNNVLQEMRNLLESTITYNKK